MLTAKDEAANFLFCGRHSDVTSLVHHQCPDFTPEGWSSQTEVLTQPHSDSATFAMMTLGRNDGNRSGKSFTVLCHTSPDHTRVSRGKSRLHACCLTQSHPATRGLFPRALLRGSPSAAEGSVSALRGSSAVNSNLLPQSTLQSGRTHTTTNS